MGRCLPLGVAGLLLAGPHPHDLASHRAASARLSEVAVLMDCVVLHHDPARGRPSARRRNGAAEVPARPPSRHAQGKPLGFLSAIRRGVRSQAIRLLVDLPPPQENLQRGRQGAGPPHLYRPRHRAAEGRRIREVSISITPPAAGRPRSPASAPKTRSPARRPASPARLDPGPQSADCATRGSTRSSAPPGRTRPDTTTNSILRVDVRD